MKERLRALWAAWQRASGAHWDEMDKWRHAAATTDGRRAMAPLEEAREEAGAAFFAAAGPWAQRVVSEGGTPAPLLASDTGASEWIASWWRA